MYPFVAPSQAGFWMPAETLPHIRTWMAWPCRAEIWPEGLPAAKRVYANIARALSLFEPVSMICSAVEEPEVRSLGAAPFRISSLVATHHDSWVRDNGASFLLNEEGRRAAVWWGFNGYGQKFKPFEEDAKIAVRMASVSHVPAFSAPLVMEGGAFHVDGEGTLITTEQCVLNPNRNPHLSKQEIAEALQAFLGVKKVIFLPFGLPHDADTDGHVDNMATFVSPTKVLMAAPSDKDDPAAHSLAESKRALEAERDALGRRIEVVQIPLPKGRPHPETGDRVCDSYINFAVVNHGVVFPLFCDAKADFVARKTLEQLYPDRSVFGVDSRALTLGGGGIHCITQQEPLPQRGLVRPLGPFGRALG